MKSEPASRPSPPESPRVSWKGTPDPYVGRGSRVRPFGNGVTGFLWLVVASCVGLGIFLVLG